MSSIQPVKLRGVAVARSVPVIGSLPGTTSSVICSRRTPRTLHRRRLLRTRA